MSLPHAPTILQLSQHSIIQLDLQLRLDDNWATLPLMALWQDGGLLWLMVHSAVYLAIGLALFSFAERLAKQRGLLGQY